MAMLPPWFRSQSRASWARSAASAARRLSSSGSNAFRAGPYQRRKNETNSSGEVNRQVKVRCTDRASAAAGPTGRTGAVRCPTAVVRARRAADSGLFDQDGTGIEQVEALTLHVLLGLRSWLCGDDRDVAAGGRGVGEPGR